MKDAITIEPVTRDNYHLYDDMVSWRMTGSERTEEEKRRSERTEYPEVYEDLEHPGFSTWAALCNGRFVGWISLMYTPKIARQRWRKGVLYIDELWVAPEYRRQGIALKLMEKAFECREKTGAVEVRVYVGDDNIPARKLYEKSGLHFDSKADYMKS